SNRGCVPLAQGQNCSIAMFGMRLSNSTSLTEVINLSPMLLRLPAAQSATRMREYANAVPDRVSGRTSIEFELATRQSAALNGCEKDQPGGDTNKGPPLGGTYLMPSSCIVR